MDSNTFQQFRTVLERRRLELLVPLARADEAVRSIDERSADAADRAEDTMSREFFFAQADANRRMLRAIEEALIRIRGGTFGECEHCGSEIPLARLKAIPWARNCVACQEELERRPQYMTA